MDSIEFKKIVVTKVREYGFVGSGNTFYYKLPDLIIVVGLQKSNYDNDYYINYGFFVRELHRNLDNPKSYECDITGRFLNDNKGLYQLNSLDNDELVKSLEINIIRSIVPVIQGGIENYFVLFPDAKCRATLALKKYLGME